MTEIRKHFTARLYPGVTPEAQIWIEIAAQLAEAKDEFVIEAANAHPVLLRIATALEGINEKFKMFEKAGETLVTMMQSMAFRPPADPGPGGVQ